METIAELNNLAVTCIDANELNKAINILVQALQLTRNQFYRHNLGSSCTKEQGQSVSCHSLPTSHAARHEEAIQAHDDTSIDATIMVANDDFRCTRGRDINQRPFIHSSALKYQQPFLAFQEIDHHYSTISHGLRMPNKSESCTTLTIQLSVIVIFNCALCHDRLAEFSILSTAIRKVLRDKAIALYEKAVDLYLESSTHCLDEDYRTNTRGITGSSSCSGSTRIVGAQQDMIAMAAVNNLVQLHHESSPKRKNYSQLMMALFHDVQRTDYGSEAIQRQVDLQARVFFANTVLSSNMELKIAAAAA